MGAGLGGGNGVIQLWYTSGRIAYSKGVERKRGWEKEIEIEVWMTGWLVCIYNLTHLINSILRDIFIYIYTYIGYVDCVCGLCLYCICVFGCVMIVYNEYESFGITRFL